MGVVRLVRCEDSYHFIVVCWVDVLIDAVSCQLYLLKWTFSSQLWHIRPGGSDDIRCVRPTCDRPKCTDAVSDMYMIFPSGATTKMKPSNVWKKRYSVEKVLLHRYKAVCLFSYICVIICFCEKCVSAHFRANYNGRVCTVRLFPFFDETWLWLHSSSALCLCCLWCADFTC